MIVVRYTAVTSIPDVNFVEIKLNKKILKKKTWRVGLLSEHMSHSKHAFCSSFCATNIENSRRATRKYRKQKVKANGNKNCIE